MAQIGLGTEVYLHNGTALTLLAEVFNASPPNEQTDQVDVTHYGSSGRRREFISGLIDGGEITIEMNYNPGSATDLLCQDAKDDGDVRQARISIPKSPTGRRQFTGNCIVTGYEIANPVDDKATATLTLKVSGAWAAADVV